MREIATDIRVAIIDAITPLTLSGKIIPVHDTELPVGVVPSSYLGSQAYVLITDQTENETTNNDCSIRQNATFQINIITKFPQGNGGKKVSETISDAIQLKMNLTDLVLPGDLQAVNIRKNFSRVQIEQGSSQIAYQKILSYTLDIFFVS
ncbi:MAG TPA: hypothetical protein VMX17_13540 [Candidatus Glassbacteria bacterium]|jgi:hypothetical protein|nr:hypothetical protein [Candidatus Glassbacteria bacterium]